MQKNINILNELKEINSAFLIDTDNQNHFFVPQDYFSDLSDIVRSNIFVQSISSENPFQAPANYFENFPGIMLDKVALNISIKKNAEYAVPQGYFDTLAGNILDKIKNVNAVLVDGTEQSSTLLNISKAKVYSVPENYFAGFADVVLNKIKLSENQSVQDELKELSPLLSGILKANVYSIPENYFSELEPLVAQPQQAKVISLSSRIRKGLNYAVAACTAAILFGGGYLFINNKNTSTTKRPKELVAKADIQQQLSGLSDEDINNYLKDNNNTAVYTSSPETEQQPNLDVQTLLQNVSDEEIQQYLNQDPETVGTERGI